MSARVDIWLTLFMQSPETVWDDFVAGRQPIPGYERADVAETLHMVFGGLPEDDPQKVLLDATLTAWMDPFLGWSDEERREFGLSRYVYWLVEVMAAASLLQLNQFRRHVFENLMTYRGIMRPLCLAPQRDPLAALYRTLAGSAEHAPTLREFWLQLCRKADDLEPAYYLNIGLLGLRHCTSRAGAPPPWIGGLAAWLPHARSKKTFVRKFRSLRALYPPGPGTWRKWIYPILDDASKRVGDRVEWWKSMLGTLAPHGQNAGYRNLRSPYPDDLKKILDKFDNNIDRTSTKASLVNLFDEHDRFVEHTGNTYYFVRAVSEMASNLLKHSHQEWIMPFVLRQVRRALVLEPWDTICWHLHGRCLAALNRPQAAEWVFWESIRRAPNNLSTHIDLARLIMTQGERDDEAEAILREANRIDPNHLHSRTELGRLLMAQERFDEAETILREANRIDPKHLHSRTELGHLLMAQKRFDEAETEMHALIKIDAHNPYALAGLKRLSKIQPPGLETEDVNKTERIDAEDLPLLPPSDHASTMHDAPVDAMSTCSAALPDQASDEPKATPEVDPVDVEDKAYDALRPPAMAKQADFLWGTQKTDQADELARKGKKLLEDLVDTDGRDVVVQFYGRRRGLVSKETPFVGDDAQQAWALEESLLHFEEGRPEPLNALAPNLPGRLSDLAKCATGDQTHWDHLCAWKKSQQLDDPTLSNSDTFVWEAVERLMKHHGKERPTQERLVESLRWAGERLLPANTELMTA